MSRISRTIALGTAVAAVALAGCGTVRVSVATGGGQGNQYSAGTAISADGRYVAFTSMASNLTPDDTDGQTDVFVRDTFTGTTTLVSIGVDPPLGGGADSPSISANGQVITYRATGGSYVRNMATATTTRLSVTGGFDEVGGSRAAQVSADGRFVAFEQTAVNDNSTADGIDHIFIRNLATGTTDLLSTPPNGPAPFVAKAPTITADGRYVAYTSGSSGAVWPPDFPQQNQPTIPFVTGQGGDLRIHVVDRQTGHRMTAPDVPMTSAPGWQVQATPSISGDGRFVAFWAYTQSLVPGGTNDVPHVWRWDTATNHLDDITQRAGLPSTTWTAGPSMSADGNRIAFGVYDPTTLNVTSIDVDDRALDAVQTTKLATPLPMDHQPGGAGPLFALSGSGDAIVYSTDAPGVVPGDTNLVEDVFLHWLTIPGEFHRPAR